MVLQVFRRRNILWLGAAILWHAAADTTAVLAVGTLGPYWTEAIVGAFAVASVIIIFALRPTGAKTPPEAASALPSVAPARIPSSDPEADLRRKMDETRFT